MYQLETPEALRDSPASRPNQTGPRSYYYVPRQLDCPLFKFYTRNRLASHRKRFRSSADLQPVYNQAMGSIVAQSQELQRASLSRDSVGTMFNGSLIQGEWEPAQI